jgi:Co/Zn/Cd efflux system component
MTVPSDQNDLRRIVVIVALLNLAYFGVEFAVARAIASVSLFADSVDFLEDASVNLLIAFAFGWSAVARARVGMAMAGILLVPALSLVWVLWEKFGNPVPPDAVNLTLTGLGALAVNLTCAFLLSRRRHHSGSLTKAAFLSARNDALANIAIIAAGFVTAYTLSVWPDVVVGLAIAAMNVDSAHEVWVAAHAEHRTVS